MSEKQAKSGTIGRTLKLFLLIFVVLLVPMAMDQFEFDKEHVKNVGRVAVGLTGLLFFYGIFTKLLKGLAFVVLALIVGVLLVCEEQVKAPRLKEMFGSGTKTAPK